MTKTEEMKAWVAGDTYQNKGEHWRAGINIGADEFNAVEAYGQTKEIAEARRDRILAALSPALHDSRLADELDQELESALCAAGWSHSLAHVHEAKRILAALRASPAPDAMRDEIPAESRLDHITSSLLNIIGEIEDESDRAYFGSTNHADELKEIAQEMDAMRWNAALRTDGGSDD